MTSQEYQKSLEIDQPLIEFNGVLKQMPFYISPELKQYPFEILKNLGELPLKVTEEENSLVVLYPGGRVRYIEECGVLIPEMVRIFIATSEPGISSFSTDQLDSFIFFSQVDEDEINSNESYLHFGDLHMSVKLLEGEKEIKDWWIGDRKG